MPISLKFYNDAGLTELTTSIAVAQSVSGTAAAVDRVIYLGSTAVGMAFDSDTDPPGLDPITISVSDAAPGGGVQASHVKLAASSLGLDSATAGAPLEIAAYMNSGVAYALPVYLRIDTPALSAGVYTDLTLTTNALIEGES